MANDPLPKSHFQVVSAGARTGVTEVHSLNDAVGPIKYRNRTNPECLHLKASRMQTFSNIPRKQGKAPAGSRKAPMEARASAHRELSIQNN